MGDGDRVVRGGGRQRRRRRAREVAEVRGEGGEQGDGGRGQEEPRVAAGEGRGEGGGGGGEAVLVREVEGLVGEGVAGDGEEKHDLGGARDEEAGASQDSIFSVEGG